MPKQFKVGDIVRRTRANDYYKNGFKPFAVVSLYDSAAGPGWVTDADGRVHAPYNLELVKTREAIESQAGFKFILPNALEELDVLDELDEDVDNKAFANDPVNHPAYYKQGGLEAIDVLEAFDLVRDGRLFNVGKYILRLGKKDSELQDAKKARWYLDRYINHLEESAK